MNDRGHRRTWILATIIGLLLLSSALVWHDLGTREVLGRDENATITKLDQPNFKAVLDATYMKVTGQPGNMQPLYFFLQYLFWPLVGRSEFMFRFVASMFGLLVVTLTYKLGEALLSREAGLVGALLTALLPLHVRYAQIARPYTLVALLSLASAYFLLRGLAASRPIHWTGFALTAALNFYTHFNSLFVLAAEGLFAGIVWLAMLVAVRRKRQPPKRLMGPVLSFLAVGLFCVPGMIRLIGLPWMGLDNGGEPNAGVTVELSVPFFRHCMYESGLTTAWLQNLIVGLVGLGLAATLYRRHWRTALLAVLWLMLPFVTLSVMKSPRPFVERYVIFVPPVALLLVGQGVVAVGQMVGSLTRPWSREWGRRMTALILSIGIALLLVAPLRAYYAHNRAEDRLDLTLTVVERHARAGDVIVVSPRFFVRPLDADGADVLYLTEYLSTAELDNLAQRYRRMWLLYTSYLPAVELQEPLDQWVQAQTGEFVRVPIKALNALAYCDLRPTDAEAGLKDRIAVLEDLAQKSSGKYEAWQRYGLLADACESLADLYDNRGESTLAIGYRNKAEETRAAFPRPW